MQAHTSVVSAASNKANLFLTLLFAQENRNSSMWTPLEWEEGAAWFHGMVERYFIFAELTPELPMWGWTGCVGWQPAGEQQAPKKPAACWSGNPAWLRLSHLPRQCRVVGCHVARHLFLQPPSFPSWPAEWPSATLADGICPYCASWAHVWVETSGKCPL